MMTIAKKMAKIGRNLSLLMLLLCLTPHLFFIENSYGQMRQGSCADRLEILEKRIIDSKFCEKNEDCVEVKYNLDGCACSSSANERGYVRSLELKVQQYFDDCVKDTEVEAKQCSCSPPVKHECIWGRCMSVRCDFNKEYQVNECECPIGSDAIYGERLDKDGKGEKTVKCRPKAYLF